MRSPSQIVEETDRFVVTTVLSKDPGRLRIATVTWRKRPFGSWWTEEGRTALDSSRVGTPVLPPANGYQLRAPRDGGCTTDTWSAIWEAPDPNYDHTAVWTGAEMIVSGGDWAGESRSSGGLYCACDGDTLQTWYPDADGDGLGVESTGIPACEQPPGYTLVGGDCDDRYSSCTTDCTDADLDDVPVCASDCDDANPYCGLDCTDADSDTYCSAYDCDDSNPDTHPGAEEVNDGLDNQCFLDHGRERIPQCGEHRRVLLVATDRRDELRGRPILEEDVFDGLCGGDDHINHLDRHRTGTGGTLPLPPGACRAAESR